MRGICGIEWVRQLYNPFGVRSGGWSIVPRVREARPWAVECNPFGVKTKSGARAIREKQHFLKTVYERFFQGYSVKTADTHGIVYTPQPIVDFMCASVEEVL